MGWTFWETFKDKAAADHRTSRLPKPKDLPTHIGMHLVVREKQDPDWVWALKCVKRPTDDARSLYDFRIFSARQAAQAGIQIEDYHTLDAYPKLILYFGYSNKIGSIFNVELGDSLEAA